MKSNKFRLLLPILLIGLWLVVSGIGGPTFAKINNVTTNNQASFLPKTADSTIVDNEQTAFISSSAIPAIVVISSNKTLTHQQFSSLLPLTAKFAKTSGVTSGAGNVVGPIPSKDGHAAEFIVQITSSTSALAPTVKELRAVLKTNVSPDLATYVTGPAGIAADLFSAFGGIDGILLYVAIGVVFFILLLVYRSIILPFIVLITAMVALSGAILLVYQLALHGVIKLNGQSQGILSILVIGATTDYSLLLISRYKEYLHEYESKWQAMRKTLRHVIEPIGASAATVCAALLCLLFSNLNSNRALGPIAAIGIVFAFLTVTTLLTSILLLFGRKAFWPFAPRVDSHEVKKLTLWEKIAGFVKKRPRAIWLSCFILLAGLSLGLFQLKASGVSETAAILGSSNAVTGQTVLSAHFPGGSGSPAELIVPVADKQKVMNLLASSSGITTPMVFSNPKTHAPVVHDGNLLVTATLDSAADSNQAESTVRQLRTNLKTVSPTTLVGGTTATLIDSNNTANSDLHKIIPIVLVVILFILMILLRAILAPLILIGSVILSFAGSLGLSALVFNHLFHFAGSDAAVPLFGFIFLVALGVDYNIFLMTRVREESVKSGTHKGIFKGLSVTGSVITSAGIVLAATFASLSVIPILFLVEIAFIVAAGVLIDTVIVRSLLVPGLTEDIGKLIWWPSKLWRHGKD